MTNPCPSNEQYVAQKLHSELGQWIAWREGRESQLLDINAGQWAHSRFHTESFRRAFDMASPWSTRSVLWAAMLIIRHARCLESDREAWRHVSRKARIANRDYDVDHPTVDQLVYWLVTGGAA